MLVLGILLLWLVSAPPEAAPAASAPSTAIRELPLEAIEPIAAVAVEPEADLSQEPQVAELVALARELLEKDECTRAAECLNRALKLTSNRYYELLYLSALARYRLGELNEAQALAEAATSVRPAAPEPHCLLGHILRQQGRLEEAIRHYRTATCAAGGDANSPRVTAAWYWLGYCLDRAGYLAAACESYGNFDTAVWETHPAHRDDEEVARLLADHPLGLLDLRMDLLRQLNRREQLVRTAAEALTRWPDDPAVARRYAVSLLEARRPAEAFSFCRQRLAELSDCAAQIRSPLLSVAAAAASTAGVLDSWRTELLTPEVTADRIDLMAAIARRLDRVNPAAAIDFWREVAARRPTDPVATWSLAAALRNAGKLAAGAQVLTDFLRRHPDASEIPWTSLSCWMSPLEAASEVDRAIEELRSGPRDFASDFVLATLTAALGEHQQAIALFSAVTQMQPEFMPAYLAWGYLLMSQYRWEEARTVAEMALKHNPQCAGAHFVLALAHAGLDENTQAEASFRAALKYAPQEAEFALAAARHYRRTGDLLGAQRYFQQALAADPASGVALENLVESYLAGGKSAIARAQFRQSEAADIPEDALRRVRTTLRFAQNPYGEEHLAELARQLEAFPDDHETGMRLAAGLFVRGRLDESFEVAQRLHGLHAEDERLSTLLARLHARRLEFSAAIEVLEKLVHRYPNRVEILTLLCENYLADFRFDEARHVLRHILLLKPESQVEQTARARLLTSYTELSDFDGALELLSDWQKADPENPAWHREKLRVLVLAGRVDQALEAASARVEPLAREFQQGLTELKSLLERLQNEPDNRGLRGDFESLNSRLAQLQSQLQQARAELIQVCLDGRQFKKAIELTRQWLEQEDTAGYEAGLTQWLVQALIADGQPDAALEVLDELVAESAQASIALSGWKARAHAAAGRIEQAAAILRQIIADPPVALDPADRADLWTQLVEISGDARRYEEALECLNQWAAGLDARDRAGRIVLLTLRCMILAEAERTEDYISAARELLQLDPDNAGLNNDLGYTLVDAGMNLSEATQMIRKAVAAQPLRAAFLDSLGWAYYKAGDFEKARFYLERAARLREGQDAVIYDHWADTEYRLGNHQAARTCWQKAVSLLQAREDRPRIGRDTRLLASVQAKLAALAQGTEPPVAPLAVPPEAQPGPRTEPEP